MNIPEFEADDRRRAKVRAIFREIAGESGDRLTTGLCDPNIARTISEVLQSEGEMEFDCARDIAFHLSDWHADAAFLVALHLFPERFTASEIQGGVTAFLIHAPNHVAAAAELFGFPVKDIFEIGSKDSDSSAPSADHGEKLPQ